MCMHLWRKNMVTWKQKYQDLKKSREQSMLGKITGTINRVTRSAPTMAANIATAVVALTPLARAIKNHGITGELTQFHDEVNKYYNPVDMKKPLWINPDAAETIIGPVLIQLGKKASQKLGGMIFG